MMSSVRCVDVPPKSSCCPRKLTSVLNGVSSTVFARSPVTLMVACCTLPGVVIVLCTVATVTPLSTSVLPLRLVKMRPSSPSTASWPVPPEIQSLP
jgi:hypothetical protein